MPAITALSGLRQEDCLGFEDSLDYIVSSRQLELNTKVFFFPKKISEDMGGG